MIVFISGHSGVGKNTVMKGVLQKLKDFKMFTSCTTRDRRADDEEGHYHYLTKQDFVKKIENGEMFEYEHIHNNYYGTLQEDFDKILAGENFIKDIGVEGRASYEQAIAGRAIMLSIFLDAPKEMIKQRLIDRGDNLEKIEVRMARIDYESQFKRDYDNIVENILLENAIEDVVNLIREKQTK